MSMLARLANTGATDKTYIEDVFSAYLYTGTGSTQTITNGIDLSGPTAPWTLYSASVTGSGSGFHSFDVDSSGNMYVGIMTSGYGYLAKLDSTGAVTWSKSFTSATEVHGVKCDSSGNVYITFITEPAGGRTPHIIKYNSSGTLQWMKLVNPLSTIGNRQYRIDVDSSGNIISAGLGYQNGGAETPGQQIFLTSSGTATWLKNVLGTGTYPHAMQCGARFDSSGNPIFSGQYNNGTGRNNLAKYNAAGTIQWNKILSFATGSGTFLDVVVDSSNNIYAAGDNNSLGLLCKFDSTGALVWQLASTSSGFYSIALHSSGDLFVSSYNGDVMRVTNAGAIVWKVKFAGSGYFPLACTTNYLYVKVNANSIAKLPVDGSAKSGLLNGVSLGDSSLTLSTASGTLSAVTYGTGNTLTMGASSVVEASSSVTTTTYNQAAKSTGGGMVWCKGRSNVTSPGLVDTARGATYVLGSNSTAAQGSVADTLTSFNSNGFSVGADTSTSRFNTSGYTYASWTFRKAPKFFDVVTYTGDGVSGRTVSHSLGQAPGMIVIKRTNTTGNWVVYHRSLGNGNFVLLHTTSASAADGGAYFNATDPTSSVFTLGSGAQVNGSGSTYVAYLFAHDTTTDGLIQCGSYTGNGSTTGPEINLGWEPQYLLVKNASATGSWLIYDTMRSWKNDGTDNFGLIANTTDAEAGLYKSYPTQTGFTIADSNFNVNTSGNTYIYMAIRRGPMRTPTDGTKVFSPIIYTGNGTAGRAIATGILTDMAIYTARSSKSAGYDANNRINDRLRSINYLSTNLTDSEASSFEGIQSFDSMNAVTMNNQDNLNAVPYALWAFRRAPGFFDVVCYTGTGAARTVNHNLGVAPELMVIKGRSTTWAWMVYNNTIGNTKALYLNDNVAAGDNPHWNSTSPTSSVFTVSDNAAVNESGSTYVAYLFASCPGVSKCGSYTGNGSSQTINCEFTNGARFVLIKRTDSTGAWYVWDTARGIVTGNDPHLSLNTTSAEVTSNDTIDPNSTGFVVNQVAATNVNVGPLTSWSSQTSQFGTDGIRSICYGNGLFVAVGNAGKLSTSTDGISWTARTSGFGTTAIYGVTYCSDLYYGSGIYVAVGATGKLSTSTNGISWTARTSGFSSVIIYGAAYGSGLCVAVGEEGQISTSTNGISWTARTSGYGGTGVVIRDVCYGNGTFVAVCNNGTAVTSNDGISWTIQSTGVSTGLTRVTYGNGVFVAVGFSGVLLTSPDGVTWTSRTSGFGTTDISALTFANGLFVVAAGGLVRSSPDGATWTTRFSALAGASCIAYGNERFALADLTGGLQLSTDPKYIYLAIA